MIGFILGILFSWLCCGVFTTWLTNKHDKLVSGESIREQIKKDGIPWFSVVVLILAWPLAWIILALDIEDDIDYEGLE